MEDKFYQESFASFQRVQCPQQIELINQQYLSHSLTNTNNATDHENSSVYDYMYNTQTSYSQNVGNLFSTCTEQIDSSVWFADPRVVTELEKGLKLSDKIETIEITSKDLSPVSCCSNTDLFPDFYKTFGKDQSGCNKTKENCLWSSNLNQRLVDYPSCAELNCEEFTNDKSVKYCSIQKSGELDNTLRNCHNNRSYCVGEQYLPQCANKIVENNEQITLPSCDLYNFNEKHIENNSYVNVQNEYFYPPPCPLNFNSVDHNSAEVSNDESDIIVEESDEEITDFSEDQDKREENRTNCLVCNMLYTPIGNQFYYLTSETPLTMSSQKPVSSLLKKIGVFQSTCSNYVCSQCLSLVNTLDNLQLKLENCQKELYEKFVKTSKENKLSNYNQHKPKQKRQSHWHMLQFKCKLCRKLFSLKKIYNYHMNKHKNVFLCEFCGKQFFNVRDIKLHSKTHANKKRLRIRKLQPFLCKICSKTFRTRSNLKEHENFCSGLLPYKCDRTNCGKKFATKTKLKNHVKLKHDKKFVAICSICNIGFIKMSDYKTHMITHSTVKKFTCSKCEKSYKTLSNLNFHMKFHDDKLPFNCDICGKGFMRKEYLETHTNSHKGLKNFTCQICGKQFASQKNLDSHVKHHDGSVKRKTCNICGKSISTSFEEHLRIHSNLKEFECDVCLMKFNTKGALAKHRKNKHKN